VIPKEIRQEAGISPGMTLDIRLRDGLIEIESAPLAVKLVRKGKLLVAVPKADVGILTSGTVGRTRQRVRRKSPRRS